MSTPERPVFTPGEEFQTIYAERENLERRASSAPALVADLFKKGLDAADIRLAALAQDPEVAGHFERLTKLGHEIVEATQALDEAELLLRAIGLDEEIDAKRRELEVKQREYEQNQSGPIARAVQFYLKIAGVETAPVPESSVRPVEGAALTEPGAAASEDQAVAPPNPTIDAPSGASRYPAVAETLAGKSQTAASETNESLKTPLEILIDPNNNISVNGEPYSLTRELQQVSRTSSEAEARQLKADVIEFFANNPDKKFRASEVWAIIRPGEEFSRTGGWNLFVKDFLRDEFHPEGKPFVEVLKTHPRLLHYVARNFDTTVKRTDEIFELEKEGVFTFPNGEEVAGETAQLLHLLDKANADNPVTKENAGDLYRLMSSTRLVIQANGLKLVRVNVGYNPSAKRPYAGYYMTGSEAQPAEPTGEGPQDPPEGDGPKAERVGVEDLVVIDAEPTRPEDSDYIDPSLVGVSREHRVEIDRQALFKLVEYHTDERHHNIILVPDNMARDLLDEDTITTLIAQAQEAGESRLSLVRRRVMRMHTGEQRGRLEEELKLRGLTIQVGDWCKKIAHARSGEQMAHLRVYRIIKERDLSIEHFQDEDFEGGKVTWRKVTKEQLALLDKDPSERMPYLQAQPRELKAERTVKIMRKEGGEEIVESVSIDSLLKEKGKWSRELRAETIKAIERADGLGALWMVNSANSGIKLRVKDLKLSVNGNGEMTAEQLLLELREVKLALGGTDKPVVRDIIIAQLLHVSPYDAILTHQNTQVREHALNIVSSAIEDYFRRIRSGATPRRRRRR
jgi:hypothetical protein